MLLLWDHGEWVTVASDFLPYLSLFSGEQSAFVCIPLFPKVSCFPVQPESSRGVAED